MDERESGLVTNTELLVEHLQAESMGIYGHLFLLFVFVLGVVDLKDDNLHLHSDAQVDIATKISIREECCSCMRACVCVCVCAVHMCTGMSMSTYLQ